jgi:hypothetical protein
MLEIIVTDKIIARYDGDMEGAYKHAIELSRQNPVVVITLREGNFKRAFRNGYSI